MKKTKLYYNEELDQWVNPAGDSIVDRVKAVLQTEVEVEPEELGYYPDELEFEQSGR